MKGRFRNSRHYQANAENYAIGTRNGTLRWRVRFGKYLTCRHNKTNDGWMRLFIVWDPAGEMRMQTHDRDGWERILVCDYRTRTAELREAILLGGLEDGTQER